MRSTVAAVLGLALCATAQADALPEGPPPDFALPVGCSASAVAPWPAAGEGYRAQAATEGEVCAEAALTLALVAPTGRALWELPTSGVGAIRVLYGVPGGREMEAELQAWISQGGSKPATAADLPVWADGAAGPEGFEPTTETDRAAYEALRAAARPLFCYADDPGFDTCLVLAADDSVSAIGRRATR